ncbi:MAG: XkdX family protein [Firmicutes bacterium]|nr:XkdX family protein [Bacillota bacterium]
MFETIRRNYLAGRITVAGVQNAVKKGWITAAQAESILTTESEVD